MSDQQQSLGRGMLWIFWLIVLGLLSYGFGLWEDNKLNPNRNPDSRKTDQVTEVILDENRYHHYIANGAINRKPVVFLLDTGATHVSVPQALATKLGLRRGPSGYAETANGRVRVYLTTIKHLRLGDIDAFPFIEPPDGKAISDGFNLLQELSAVNRENQLTPLGRQLARLPIDPRLGRMLLEGARLGSL